MKSEDYLAIFSLSSVLKMAVPHLITRIMFVPTQMGRAMIPIAIETASLMTMKISIVRQPPMQIMLFMKPDSTDSPQKSAAMA